MFIRFGRGSFLLLLIVAVMSVCWAGSCDVAEVQKTPAADQNESVTEVGGKCPDKLSVDEIIEKLTKSNKSLKSYQARIVYTFTNFPELVNSVTVRKGNLYYLKGKKRSDLLIDFVTMKQDKGDEEKHIEKYLFDGVYLKIFDFQNKTINTYQKTEKDKPQDAFDLIGTEFPMIGFTKTDSLQREFDISLVEDPNTPKNVISLLLKAKKGSIYEDEYKTIRFWIDKKTFLPARVVATAASTEEDIYDIELLEISANKKLPKGIFKVETGDDFSENMHPLKK